MNMAQYGRIEIHLADLLEKSGLSKNKLCHRAEMQRTQINGYCNNTISLIIPGISEPPVRTLRAIYSGNSEPPYWALLHIFPLYCKYTPLV